MKLFYTVSRIARYFVCLTLLLLTISINAAPPRWIRMVPKADKPTFYYVVEDATSSDEEAAHNKAVGEVLQHAIMSLGLPFSSTQVATAINTGTLVSKMAEWKIPINEVCRYTQEYEGGVRVYVLFQVAKAGNIDPDFSQFRACGSTRDKIDDQMNLRPDKWRLYETETYFSTFEEMDIDTKIDAHEFKASMEEMAKQALAEDLNLSDSSLLPLIHVDYYSTKKVGFAVAYIERRVILDKYEDDIVSELTTCFDWMEAVDSYLTSDNPDGKLSERNINNAKAFITRVKDKLGQIEPKINFMNAYATSRSITRSMEDVKDLKKQINDKTMLTLGSTQKAKEGKVYEFINLGKNAIQKQMVGDALRYFYAAQLFLANIPDNDYIVVEDEVLQQEMRANLYLQNKITHILKHVQVTCDGFVPDNEEQLKLSFRYEGVPVTNMNFSYNLNEGWSDVTSVINGWGLVELPRLMKPNIVHIRLEYRYADEANFDAELPLLMKTYSSAYDYDTHAKSEVSIVHKPVQVAIASQRADTRLSTNISQNYVANRIREEGHKVSMMDASAYHDRIRQVCNAIKKQTYDSVLSLFTMEGFQQFEALIKYGKARVVSLEGVKYIRLGTDVQCRSIPMNFSFSKGKQQLENVVFTFNKQGKIDGIQFALEESSARSVMANTDVDETSRLTLINFLENYKTAYALKRIDYIESIFSNDAVIITGRVLHRTEQDVETKQNQMLLDNVLYTRMSKGQYIKRLKTSFASKEWINVKFGETMIDPSLQENTFGIRLVQDYYSSNYGDHGYLFLLVDASDKAHPVIRVRTWQPNLDSATPFTLDDYDRMTSGQF